MTISSTRPSFSKIFTNRGNFDVFLLASDSDRKICDKIHESLMRQGLTVWEQPENLKETSLQEKASQAIAKARVIVYLVSANSEQSAICRQDLALALKHNKQIIPVIIEKGVLKSFLPFVIRHPWVDLTKYDDQHEYDVGVQQLVKIIQRLKSPVPSPKPISTHQPRNYRQVTIGLLILSLLLGMGGLSWGGMTWLNGVNDDKQEAITLANEAQEQAAEALEREQIALKEAEDAKTNLSIVIAREQAAKTEAAEALEREQAALKEAKDAKTNLSIVIAREQAAKAELAEALKGEKDAKTNLSIVIAREKAAIEQAKEAQAKLDDTTTQLTQTREELDRANQRYYQAQQDLKEAVNRANQAEEQLKNYSSDIAPNETQF